jgi:four helix bundle protein
LEQGYEKLEVFKLSRQLAVEVHKLTLNLPKFELYEEGSQVRRSAKSIPANLVEGYCLRRHLNEYLQYLHRAFASCEETRLHLEILFETGSLRDGKKFQELSSKYNQLGKMIFRFIESVGLGHMPPSLVKEPEADYQSG